MNAVAWPMEATVIKWEYFVAPVLSHVAQQILNNFGSEGWELVQLALGPNPDSLVGYFKRPSRDPRRDDPLPGVPDRRRSGGCRQRPTGDTA